MIGVVSACKAQKTTILPPLRYNLITNQFGLKATSKRAQNTKKKPALPPWPTMEPEAAQDSDAPVARCPPAPIESTAPL